MTKTFPNGSVSRYDDDGKLHAENEPAVTHPDGTYAWFKHGKTHRKDGPAVFIKRESGIDVLEYWEDGVMIDSEEKPAAKTT